MTKENGNYLVDLPVRLTDIINADKRIKSYIKESPCDYTSEMSKLLRMEVYLKKETIHDTFSYKERGALNTLLLLDEKQRKIGVIAASAGNHALALSFHGKRLNIPVNVVMPISSSNVKAELCKEYGANVIKFGADFAEAYSHGMKLAEKHGYEYINGYDDPRIIAGQGTVGLELMKQVDNLDAIVVPVGGGGLIAGILASVKEMKPTVKVIGVQTNYCHCIATSLEEGRPVKTDADFCLTIADGLAVSTAGENSHKIIQKLIDELIVIDESSIPTALLSLAEASKCVVEGAGATGIAAALDGKLNRLKNKKVAFVLTGGNIDMFTYVKSLGVGLINQGKLSSFSIVSDGSPSHFIELMKILEQFSTKIKNIECDHTFYRGSVKLTRFIYKVICSTKKIKEDMQSELQAHYQQDYELIS